MVAGYQIWTMTCRRSVGSLVKGSPRSESTHSSSRVPVACGPRGAVVKMVGETAKEFGAGVWARRPSIGIARTNIRQERISSFDDVTAFHVKRPRERSLFHTKQRRRRLLDVQRNAESIPRPR